MQYPTIEKNIPIPKKQKYTAGQKEKWRPFIEKLGIGDSFVCRKPNLHSCFYNYGVTVKVRHLGNNKFRYWRIK